MRHFPTVLLPACLCLAACDFSLAGPATDVTDDDAVELSGTVLDMNGDPVTGAVVSFSSAPVFCLFGCGGGEADARTDDAGRYVLVLSGDNVAQGGHAFQSRVAVSREAPTGTTRGVSTAMVFFVKQTTLAIPPLVAWDTTLNVEDRGNARVLRFQALPPAAGLPADAMKVAFTEPGTMWEQQARPDAEIPADVFEDMAGELALMAGGSVGEFSLTITGPAVALVAGNRVPASRGRPCAWREDNNVYVTSDACPFTDGRSRDPAAPPPATMKWVAVDLGEVVLVERVIARGASSEAHIEVSLDGRAWLPPTLDVLGAYALHDFRTPVPARHVRLAASGLSLQDFAVFGAPMR